MSAFLKLFGVPKEEIRKDVIITPFLNLDYFKIDKKIKASKGFLLEVLNEERFSVIKTGVGAPFVGDAVLYLKDSACKRLYFIGSCGAVANLDIGDLVVVNRILNLESFSDTLNHVMPINFINEENTFSDELLNLDNNIKKINLATIGSLNLQISIKDYLDENNIDAVDMESSAFFSAAKKINIKSLALLYVTDIISQKPFSRDLSKDESDTIKESRRKAISLICNFIQKQNA